MIIASIEVAIAPSEVVARRRPRDWPWLLPGAIFMLVFVVRAGRRPHFGWSGRSGWRFTLFDDAMISMTYARTLARTGQLEWYEGAPRVEGITNPLWTLLMAVIHLAGLDGSEAALTVSLIGVVLVLATALAVARLVRRLIADLPNVDLIARCTAGAVPFLYSSTFWTLRGMEVGLLALLAVMLVTDAGRGRWTLAVVSAVGIATRLDFGVVVAVVLACSVTDRQPADRRRLVVWLAVPAALTAAAVLVWQRAYYDMWLPNTFHLKLDGVAIDDRLWRGLLNLGKAAPLVVASVWAMLLVGRGDSEPARTARLAGACVLVACGYSVWVGGDAWEWSWMINRYVSAVLPVGLALIAAGVAIAIDRRTRWSPLTLVALAGSVLATGLATNDVSFGWRPVLVLAIVAALAAGVVVTGRSAAAVVLVALAIGGAYPAWRWIPDAGLHVRDDQRASEQGIALGGRTSNDAVIATVWAGAPAYYADRTMVDLLGKSDTTIAGVPPRGELYPGHNRWDFDYSIGLLRPDVVLGTWGPISEFDAILAGYGYELRCLTLPDESVELVWVSTDAKLIDDLPPCER